MPVRGGRPQDTLALLAAVAGIAAYTIAEHVSTWPAWLEQFVPRVLAAATIAAGVTLALGVVVLAGCAVVLRRRYVGGLLARRETLGLVPADTLDPSLDGVVRFAAQLVRSRCRGRGWLERPAAAIRIRIHSAPGGRLAYQVAAPEHAGSVLRSALGEYPEVDLRASTAVSAAGDTTQAETSAPAGAASTAENDEDHGGAGEGDWDAC